MSYRRFVTWLAERDHAAAEAAWGQVLAGFDTPTLVGPTERLAQGQRNVASFRVSAETTAALGEFARAQRTTVNTVLQAGWAQLLCGLTGQRDVAFGAAVSGRPTDMVGAESMVGLLINTVPVRADLAAAGHHRGLLEQLQNAYNETVDHQHLALATSTASPVRTSCSTPCSSTRTTRSNPPHWASRRAGHHRIQPAANTTTTPDHAGPTRPTIGPSHRIRHRSVHLDASRC